MSDTYPIAPEMVVPSIHLNGSSRRELVNQIREALDALRPAIDTLRRAAPHPRDYYVKDDTAAFVKAHNAHLGRLNALETVQHELEELGVAIMNAEGYDAR